MEITFYIYVYLHKLSCTFILNLHLLVSYDTCVVWVFFFLLQDMPL